MFENFDARNLMGIEDRVVIVTGGGKGIGCGTATGGRDNTAAAAAGFHGGRGGGGDGCMQM